ncbi:LysR substrate-binding domain-containing protein [Lentibacillus amyloliquefaciens]|uniref:LysR family transcriptional regulator n=1 Tax=Lentibacillus amyloliquefaciens TaxID=1472767 RepID=A0A0U3NTP4_9BACI|nr:LysR substrate-binding domain-containing protein [Lentibacillus amyloliquefaciens]ALX49963.1 LysR family transcriptional regulator [Lentibacillus amyloliquefaciens]
MDIRQLTCFAEVARQLNVTRAAQTLHISQPSLSKTIKNLETEVGSPLFDRSAYQLELTDAGEAFLTNTKKVLDSFENLTSKLDDVIDLKKGEIKIGIPPIIGAAFFAALISRYKEAYPSIDLLLTEVGSNSIREGISEGELDIGLICNLPAKRENLETISLLKDPLMLMVHKDNPLAGEEAIEFEAIEQEPLILYRHDFSLHDRIMEACAYYGFEPKVVCESSQKDFMIEMAGAKLGSTLLPSRICNQIDSDQLVAIPFTQPVVNLELAMIWNKEKYMPYAVREFIDMAESFRV